MSDDKEIGCLACEVGTGAPIGKVMGDAFARGFGSAASLLALRGVGYFGVIVAAMCQPHRDGVASVVGEVADGYGYDPSKLAHALGMKIQKVDRHDEH